MNPLPEEIWNRGLSYADYRAGITRNQDNFDEVWSQPTHRPDDLEILRQLPPLRVLAIGEDWCPDVHHTLPTWARIAEELPGWSLRVFARDQHPDRSISARRSATSTARSSGGRTSRRSWSSSGRSSMWGEVTADLATPPTASAACVYRYAPWLAANRGG
jgi:hypothetical protein